MTLFNVNLKYIKSCSKYEIKKKTKKPIILYNKSCMYLLTFINF